MSHPELDDLLGKGWRKPAFVKNALLRWTLIVGFVAYLIAAFMTIEVDWGRVYEGLDRGWAFVLAFTSPDFISRWSDIWSGLLESIVMTVAASVVGILISIPIGLGAARNIAPFPVYVICRGIVAISRALQEIIVAILLVAIFGFGPLAGFLTLSFATIGFLSKLSGRRYRGHGQSAGRGDQSLGRAMDAMDQLRRAAAGHAATGRAVDVQDRYQLSRKCNSWACGGRRHWGNAEYSV